MIDYLMNCWSLEILKGYLKSRKLNNLISVRVRVSFFLFVIKKEILWLIKIKFID